MIAVALNHPLQQSQMLIINSRQSVLVDDEDALAVADVEQGGCHGVMRSAISVAADSFQLFDTPCLKGIRNGRPYAGMILMQVHSF